MATRHLHWREGPEKISTPKTINTDEFSLRSNENEGRQVKRRKRENGQTVVKITNNNSRKLSKVISLRKDIYLPKRLFFVKIK